MRRRGRWRVVALSLHNICTTGGSLVNLACYLLYRSSHPLPIYMCHKFYIPRVLSLPLPRMYTSICILLVVSFLSGFCDSVLGCHFWVVYWLALFDVSYLESSIAIILLVIGSTVESRPQWLYGVVLHASFLPICSMIIMGFPYIPMM